MPKKISIREDLYAELQTEANKYDLKVGQLIDQLLEKEVTNIAHKQLFSPGLKWSMPKKAIMAARVLMQDMPRLKRWLQHKDLLQIIFHGDEGEIYVINEAEAIRQEIKRSKQAGEFGSYTIEEPNLNQPSIGS